LYSELKRRNVIRVVVAYLAGSWLLIQVADTVFPAFGLPESGISILITVLAIGLVPAVVISWAFELTSKGLKRDADVAPGESIAPRIGKRIDRIVIVVLALGVGFFAFDKFVLDPARDAALEQEAEQRGRSSALVESYGDKSIAVLPFADLSPNGDQAYFSDGIAEEILNLLAKVRELRVISRSSAFQYRGNDVHIPTVAEELNVSYVLEGSVRSAGDRIRITAQLIDAQTDTHVWSENFDRELADIFVIQDDIAQSIVGELQITLLGAGPQSARTDPETYALYLQANHLINVEQQGSETAEALLQQALERDPDYTPALNLMVNAIFELTSGSLGDGTYTHEEGIPLMRDYVDRVLAIDPENSAALAHRSWMAFFYRNDLETAAQYLNLALEYDPANDWALFVAMVTSLRIGRNDDAIAFAEAALARDPLCSGCLYNLMNASVRSGRLDQAQAASERRMRLASGGWFTLGDIHLLKGDVQKALQHYDKQIEDPPVAWLRSRAIAFHELRDFEARDKAISQLEEFDSTYVIRLKAEVHAWLGNIDESFDYLDGYLDPGDPDFLLKFTHILWNPFFRNLSDDPRWLALREEADLGPERLGKIRIEMP
jgi:TolB-like protein